MSRRAAIWALGALLGIVFAAAITWATSQLTSQHIGLSSEPISADSRLAPPVAERSAIPRLGSRPKGAVHKTSSRSPSTSSQGTSRSQGPPVSQSQPATQSAPATQSPPPTQSESTAQSPPATPSTAAAPRKLAPTVTALTHQTPGRRASTPSGTDGGDQSKGGGGEPSGAGSEPSARDD